MYFQFFLQRKSYLKKSYSSNTVYDIFDFKFSTIPLIKVYEIESTPFFIILPKIHLIVFILTRKYNFVLLLTQKYTFVLFTWLYNFVLLLTWKYKPSIIHFVLLLTRKYNFVFILTWKYIFVLSPENTNRSIIHFCIIIHMKIHFCIITRKYKLTKIQIYIFKHHFCRKVYQL